MLAKVGKDKIAMNDQIQKLVKQRATANKTPGASRPKSSSKVDGVIKANVTKINIDKNGKKVKASPLVPNIKIGLTAGKGINLAAL